MKQTLIAGLPALNLSLTDHQIDQFCRYGDLLIEKNQVMNLTAITEPQRIATLHFLDSIALLNLAEFHGKSVIDIGCGAGFPGLPLKLADPSIHLTLLDSLNKRIAWLRDEVLPALDVEATCISGRAEEYAAKHRERHDIAVSRAVARLNILAELCLPLVKPGGYFLAMKGQATAEEVEEAKKAIKLLGGKIEKIWEYPVEDAMHKVVLIRKVSNTPAKYPRAFAKIKKQPL